MLQVWGDGHYASNPDCPARSKTCVKCKRIGHYAIKCKTRISNTPERKDDKAKHQVHYMDGNGDENSAQTTRQVQEGKYEYAFTVRDTETCGNVEVEVGGVLIDMMIDSGASCNIIDAVLWSSLKSQGIKCTSQKVKKNLYVYGVAEPLETLGSFKEEMRIAGHSKKEKPVMAEILVIKTKGPALLGRDTAIKLGVLRIGPQVNAVNSIDSIVARYPECFEGFGKLKDFQAKIHIDPNVKPIAQPMRRIPYHLRSKVEAKLQELEQLDIIEKVEGPTPWVNPVVVVPKSSGDIRLCIDMRRANTAVIRERHPIPTVDEVLQSMNQSTVFSRLDMRMGFHQIELEEESRNITVFVTRGRN